MVHPTSRGLFVFIHMDNIQSYGRMYGVPYHLVWVGFVLPIFYVKKRAELKSFLKRFYSPALVKVASHFFLNLKERFKTLGTSFSFGSV